jgi:Tetratricopeptide repeat
MRILAVLLLAGCASTATTPATAPLPAVPPPVMSAETRARHERNLAEARAAFDANPDSADAIIWLGRRLAYLGKYAEAIDMFSIGIEKHPRDARMYRHRGHRWITMRQFDNAVADLSHAASIVRGRPDEVEPDGLPNARNIPLTTLQSNIHYHLGLAHYLKGDFERALNAYRECLAVSKNPDGLVSASHWLYMTLRRLGRPDEAEKVLAPIGIDMDIVENGSYHKLLLMYRGEVSPDELEATQDPNTVDGATILYGIGNWWIYSGQPDRAKPIFARVTQGSQWPAFGFIAAESDLKTLSRAGAAGGGSAGQTADRLQ